MKRFLVLFGIFICSATFAHTINWHVDGNIYQTTTCSVGDSVTPPTAPSKYGYHLKEWLPYIPIEYLESTGTQWIDTGVVATRNTGVDITGQYLSNNISEFDTLIGVSEGRDGDTSKRFYPFSLTYMGGYIRQTHGNNQYEQPYNTNIHNIEYNIGAKIVVDNTQVATLSINQYTPSNGSLYLFAVNGTQNPKGPLWFSKGRIYSCKIYDNDTLVRDFIPVIGPNGTPCMYDKVTKQFFYNAGTGDFIAGPVVYE